MDPFETERLILRPFEPRDAEALFLILGDKAANRFLPWYPLTTIKEAEARLLPRLPDPARPDKINMLITRKSDGAAVGLIKVSEGAAHDLGYALRSEFWGRGYAAEAARAFVEALKRDTAIPYVTATHDKNNPRSGRVMQKIGMRYCYSYDEQWMPKNLRVTFRLYQLDLRGAHPDFASYRKSGERWFIETI